MSWDISLLDPVTHQQLEADQPHQMYGGTYCVGGTTELYLNVTYNYGRIFRKEGVLGSDGVHVLDGMGGAQSIPLLEKAISALSDDVDKNYWIPTEGNAKRALCQLLALARMRPDGVWEVK